MTLDEILPLLLIFNTIINVCILWYVICISTDIKRNRFSLEDMLSMIYQSMLHQFNELSSKNREDDLK